MRKYIVGFIVGAALTFAVQAGAASLLGSTIDAVIQVEVDGENLGQAPVIDGTSYLPVRKLGEASGYNVEFGEGKATLTSKEIVPVATATEQPPIETGDSVVTETPAQEYTLETINEVISEYEKSLYGARMNVKMAKGMSVEEDARLQAALSKMEQELERLQAIKTKLQATP